MTRTALPELAPLLGAAKVDCHCHVLDPEAFAYGQGVGYRPAGQETGSADYFLRVLDAYGVQHALLVGPNSGYGSDNRCLLGAIAAGAGRFLGIAVLAHDASTDMLQELRSQGVVGVAFNPALHGIDYYRAAGPLMRRLAELDMFVQVQVEGEQMHRLSPMLLDSGARLLVDHCGRPELSSGLAGAGFEALLRMAESGRTTVKLSGFAKFSQQDFPFDDVHAFPRRLLQAFGPAQCVWASDWPFLKAGRRLDYGPLLQLLARMVPDAQQRHQVLWDTPSRLFGFTPS